MTQNHSDNQFMKKSRIIFTYCVGFIFIVAGFIIDGFNDPKQHTAFSPLGITCYVIGVLVFVVGVVYIINARKSRNVQTW
jgi:uncharacterized membrane protein HdeD (DUF308 family)